MITAGTAADLGTTTGTSHTASFTMPSGDNSVLVVTIALTVNPVNGNDLVSITYNGFAVPLVQSRQTDDEVHWLYQALLFDATPGAHDLVVMTAHSDVIAAGVNTLFGVHLGYMSLDASFTDGTNSATTFALNVTTVADNCWTVLSAGNFSGDADNLDAIDCTQRAVDVGTGLWGCYDSDGPISPPGLTTMTIGGGTTPGPLIGLIFSIAPYSPPSSGEIAFDHVELIGLGYNVSSLSGGYAISVADGGALLLTVFHELLASESTIDVTYGGHTLTYTGQLVRGSYVADLFLLLNAPAGLALATVTLSSTTTELFLVGGSYLGVDPVLGVDAITTTTGTTDTLVAAITTRRTGVWVIGVCLQDNANSLGPIGVDGGYALRQLLLLDSATAVPIGNQAVTITFADVSPCGAILLALAPQTVHYFASPLTQIAGAGPGVVA